MQDLNTDYNKDIKVVSCFFLKPLDVQTAPNIYSTKVKFIHKPQPKYLKWSNWMSRSPFIQIRGEKRTYRKTMPLIFLLISWSSMILL